MHQTFDTESKNAMKSGHRPPRIWELDAARGIAILWMISFHLLFDLKTYVPNDGYGLMQWPQAFWDGY